MTQTVFNDRPVSKVLVLDNSAADSDVIKQFCSDNDLIGLKVRKDALLAVLRTNIDLGGVLYSEDYGDTAEETAKIAAQIHAARPNVKQQVARGGDGLMPGADRDLVKVWEKVNAPRFDAIMLKTKTVGVEAKKDGIHVSFEGEQAPARARRYDMVLVAVGRSPNGKLIDAGKATLPTTMLLEKRTNPFLRVDEPHIRDRLGMRGKSSAEVFGEIRGRKDRFK